LECFASCGGFVLPRIASVAVEWTPSAAIIRSAVMTVPSKMVIEGASGFCPSRHQVLAGVQEELAELGTCSYVAADARFEMHLDRDSGTVGLSSDTLEALVKINAVSVVERGTKQGGIARMVIERQFVKRRR
jgi:hypothetical protein